MRLLLDAHLTPVLAQQLRRHDVDAVALQDWMDGNHRNSPDAVLLAAAYADCRVLVTYDCRTIPVLIKELAETGQHHGGVILVDGRTFRASDVGGLLHALRAIARQIGDENWEDRVIFLQGQVD